MAASSRRRKKNHSFDTRELTCRRPSSKDAIKRLVHKRARKRVRYRKPGFSTTMARAPLHPNPETQPSSSVQGHCDSCPLHSEDDDIEMLDRSLSFERIVGGGKRHWRRALECARGGIRPKQLGGESSSSGGGDRKLSKQSKASKSNSAKPARAKAPAASKAPVPPVVVDDNAFNSEEVEDMPFLDAVVKVFCIHTEPNFSLPWQRKRQFSTNSSGFIIGGNRVLTNAHSVEHHTQVKVKRRGSDIKFVATVLAIGTECDIAMLTVNDDAFWRGVAPVVFGALPRLQDPITVVGYPIGGDTISVTSGVVSRIEITSYVHGASELLGVQIDAAINAGNSGGPSFNDRGQCIGIAFQSLKHEDCENIGYVIPTPVISHFIMDYERHGHYTGFPVMGIEWQRMENPDLRRAVGMRPNQKGVRIRRVEPTAPAATHLRSSDILLSFDGVDIANDGTVPFRHGERIGFTYLVSQKYTEQRARIRVLRGGQIMEHSVEVTVPKRLVPAHNKGKPPSYYIIAGIVFAAVSVPYLRSELLLSMDYWDSFTECKQLFLQYGKDYDYDAPVKLLDKLMHNFAQTEDEQLVVISQVLAADVNIGYEDVVNTQILAFNGIPVRNLKHLAHMVENCHDGFLRFDLEYQQMIVLDTKCAKSATPEILATHCIPSAMSDDLKS